MPREITNKVLEKTANGELSWESLARAALGYMSEDEVHHLAESEGFIEWYDEDEE